MRARAHTHTITKLLARTVGLHVRRHICVFVCLFVCVCVYRDHVIANRSITVISMREEVRQGSRDLDRFKADYTRFQTQLAHVQSIPSVW